MPVLFVRCPGKATMKALFKKILQGLGIDLTMVHFRNREENELSKIIADLLIKMKVRLIIIDEFHHRSEEHTSELQSLMRHSYAVFFLTKKTYDKKNTKI